MGSEMPEEREGNEQPRVLLNGLSEVKERLSRIESFIKQAGALAAMEGRRVEEIKESFDATLGALESQLREKEEALNQKDSALQEREESLQAQILDLETRFQEKEKLLGLRDVEVKELSSKCEEATALAATEAKRVEEVRESLEAGMTALEAQLREKEETVNQKDSALKKLQESFIKLEEGLTARIREFGKTVRSVGPEAAAQSKKRRGAPKDPHGGVVDVNPSDNE